MPDGDPTVFGLPCRFPAAPSIRPESRVQGLARKDFSVRGEPRKNFFPEFPGAAGKGDGAAPASYRPWLRVGVPSRPKKSGGEYAVDAHRRVRSSPNSRIRGAVLPAGRVLSRFRP